MAWWRVNAITPTGTPLVMLLYQWSSLRKHTHSLLALSVIQISLFSPARIFGISPLLRHPIHVSSSSYKNNRIYSKIFSFHHPQCYLYCELRIMELSLALDYIFLVRGSDTAGECSRAPQGKKDGTNTKKRQTSDGCEKNSGQQRWAN